MKNARLILFLILSLTIAPGFCSRAAQTEEDINRFLVEFARVLADVKTVFSEFEQERRMTLLTDPLVSKGVIVFETPGSVRWETTEPYRSILVAVGKDVAQFEWINDRWKRLEIGYAAAMAKVMDSMTWAWRGKLADQQKDYTFALQTGDETVLTMTPRDAGVREFINAIEMHFEKNAKAAQSIVLKEPSGDVTIIRLRQQRINPALPKDCFSLDHPLELETLRQAIANEK